MLLTNINLNINRKAYIDVITFDLSDCERSLKSLRFWKLYLVKELR